MSEAYEKGVHPAFARLAAVCLRQGLAHKYCSISANKLVEDLQALFDTRVMCYMTSAFWKWCVKQRSGQAIFNLGNLHDDQGDFTKAQTFWEDAAETQDEQRTSSAFGCWIGSSFEGALSIPFKRWIASTLCSTCGVQIKARTEWPQRRDQRREDKHGDQTSEEQTIEEERR